MSKAVYNMAAVCNLRHPLKAVLKELAWHANDYGADTWPSVGLLAKRTGLTRRAVQKQLRTLESIGAINGRNSRLGGRRKSTEYCIDLSWLSANTVRSFSAAGATDPSEKDERESTKTANRKPQNSEPRSPEQKEQEYEKNAPFPARIPKSQTATPYEQQRLRRSIRNQAGKLVMPSQMNTAEIEARRQELKRQAVELLKDTVSVTAIRL